MKRFLILCIFALNIMACDEGIKLLSSKKQLILHGIPSTLVNTNYHFEITLLNAIKLQVDSILVCQDDKIYKINHLLSKNKNRKNYQLTAVLTNTNFPKTTKRDSIGEKVIIYYQANDKNDKLSITQFTCETIIE